MKEREEPQIRKFKSDKSKSAATLDLPVCSCDFLQTTETLTYFLSFWINKAEAWYFTIQWTKCSRKRPRAFLLSQKQANGATKIDFWETLTLGSYKGQLFLLWNSYRARRCVCSWNSLKSAPNTAPALVPSPVPGEVLPPAPVRNEETPNQEIGFATISHQNWTSLGGWDQKRDLFL